MNKINDNIGRYYTFYFIKTQQLFVLKAKNIARL